MGARRAPLGRLELEKDSGEQGLGTGEKDR